MPALGVQGDLCPWCTQGRAAKKERSRNSSDRTSCFFLLRQIYSEILWSYRKRDTAQYTSSKAMTKVTALVCRAKHLQKAQPDRAHTEELEAPMRVRTRTKPKSTRGEEYKGRI